MSMYYLHRNGETTGPFAPGRLAQMIESGEISPGDQACEHGTEEWMPVELVAQGPAAQPSLGAPRPAPVKMVRKRPFFWVGLLVFFLGLGFIGWAFLGFATSRVGGGPLSFGTGLLLFVLGILIDRPRWLCGGCGNRIEKTSAMCPACRLRVVRK